MISTLAPKIGRLRMLPDSSEPNMSLTSQNRHSSRFIYKANIRVRGRTYKVVRQPSNTTDPKIIENLNAHDYAFEEEHMKTATTQPKTPKFQDNALNRENDAEHRRWRVQDGQGSKVFTRNPDTKSRTTMTSSRGQWQPRVSPSSTPSRRAFARQLALRTIVASTCR